MMQVYHNPVLLNESVEGLNIVEDGVYVDVTFGGGGHSRAILDRLGPSGKLVAFDQDQDALTNLIEDDRFLLINENFRYIKRFLRFNGVTAVDGILADFGVSSHQFDVAERGFSTRF
ncbi:MAG: 16S rRNA (cytosine(1402)-N(4))-methyltransferase, partial [Bacteroidia bacterium]|nr:16S rRNA (cytosine(1402)-N(4))-methyltransferase [Bacteroidia bacterium]